MSGPVYIQCPDIRLPSGVVCGTTQTKLGPGLGGFDFEHDIKNKKIKESDIIRVIITSFLDIVFSSQKIYSCNCKHQQTRTQ
jgi:hypothetical protein